MSLTRLNKWIFIPVLYSILLIGCNHSVDNTLFRKVDPNFSGVHFSNNITVDELNVHDNPYIYLGGGVAVGDLTGNGLPDIFLTGNQVSSRLYFNLGDMKFEDVTESAGVSTSQWATGASMVDIDGDGLLDIYVSVAGLSDTPAEMRRNLLYINKGDGTFTESASEFNLADTSFTTQSAFFDYNGDGFLDVYLLNNSELDFAGGSIFSEGNFRTGSDISFDKLYRNNGNGTFTDVSEEAGILREIGYGLGIAIADINRDGCPDIYISNDLDPNSILYINNGDGTFTNRAPDWLKHTSLAGMGTDIADFNNDGWPDILVADMMPEDLRDRKKMSGSITFEQQMDLIGRGINYQYSMNTLQLSNGMKPNGEMVFSEIGRQAGISYTDWSWSTLMADFNNNGLKDIFITNGFPKAVYDFDFKIQEFSLVNRSDTEARNELLQLVSDLYDIFLPNYIFENNGDLKFINKTVDWGLNHEGYSYGAAYADLNNNGKLDLIINNINEPASIYENQGVPENQHTFLKVHLDGSYPNSQGIGSELIVTIDGSSQYLSQSPYRGYQSTVDNILHFGLGSNSKIDSLEIFWPDGRYQLLTDLTTNQQITLSQEDAKEYNEKLTDPLLENHHFESVEKENLTTWKHSENNSFIDFKIQPQLPHRLSRLGPVIASGDVNGNGLDDLYIGGVADSPGLLLIQQSDGSFKESEHSDVWEKDRRFKDSGALFFDATGNGILDLYVASGGYEISPSSQLHQDRLYINRGDGNFVRSDEGLPEMITSTQAIAAGDFTGNGLMDLFVGGRLTPYLYPLPPRSYLLINEGGTFTDATEQVASELLESGMITDAEWVDLDNDGMQDLVLSGIWLPVQFFRNDGSELINITEDTGLPPMRGWWYSLAVADLNGNGYSDIVAGNLGLNHTFTTSTDDPLGLYAADFNNNRQMDNFFTKRYNQTDQSEQNDPGLFSFKEKNEDNESVYPFFGLAKYGMQHPQLMQRYKSFERFAVVDMEELFRRELLNRALRLEADTFESSIFYNNGDGTFTARPLPSLAQISPVKSILIFDVEDNGFNDLILAGNIYATDPEIPRADAGNGLWLKNDGAGNFIPISPFESGFLAPKDVKTLSLVRSPNGNLIVIGNNDDYIRLYKIR
mgnify:CR=1 FL=1